MAYLDKDLKKQSIKEQVRIKEGLNEQDVFKKTKLSKDRFSKLGDVTTKEEEVKKKLLTSASTELFGKKYENLSTQEIEKLVGDSSVTITSSYLAELGITTLDPKDASIEDIIDIIETREVVEATRASVFTFNYTVEKTPIPSKNNIYSISSLDIKNLFNKPKVDLDSKLGANSLIEFDPNDDRRYYIENFILQGSCVIPLMVSGDNGANYEFVIHDGDGAYYNPETDSFEKGYQSIKGRIGDEVISKSALEDTMDKNKGTERHNMAMMEQALYNNNRTSNKHYISIPATAVEKQFEIFFTKETIGQYEDVLTRQLDDNNGGIKSDTIYSPSAPNEKNPWHINQLINTTTTIKISSDSGFGVVGGTKVINHAPGAMLSSLVDSFLGRDDEPSAHKREIDSNSLSATDSPHAFHVYKGTGDFDNIRVGASLFQGKVEDEMISAYTEKDDAENAYGINENAATQILSHNLLASVDSSRSLGTVTGTMLLGKASLRSSIIDISAEMCFDLAAN